MDIILLALKVIGIIYGAGVVITFFAMLMAGPATNGESGSSDGCLPYIILPLGWPIAALSKII